MKSYNMWAVVHPTRKGLQKFNKLITGHFMSFGILHKVSPYGILPQFLQRIIIQ